MRKALIAGNWKMNATHLEAIQMVQRLSYRLDAADYDRVDVVIIPPFTALRSAQTVIEADRLSIKLGAQNCHYEKQGMYTGEVSPLMLQKLSVSHVTVGHSERRQIFGETDEGINRKVKAVLAHDMTPILCVGETEAEKDEGRTEDTVVSQVRLGLAGLSSEEVGSLAIAYEPIWAIGTGRTASAAEASSAIGAIRSAINDAWDSADQTVRILYGGSVNPGNIAGFMAKRDIDGALVGGASLAPDTFASVVRYWV